MPERDFAPLNKELLACEVMELRTELRAKALEEAAGECDKRAAWHFADDNLDGRTEEGRAIANAEGYSALNCATAIRALKVAAS